MTSFRRFEANRRNALRSTGPKTEDGKRRSRLNAVRHGLTAETVVGSLEDAEDYKAFEATIISDYCAETAVARELVLRLASLLWRLRRATAIETDLLEIQAEILRERRLTGSTQPKARANDRLSFALSRAPFATGAFTHARKWLMARLRGENCTRSINLTASTMPPVILRLKDPPIDLLLPASCQSRQRRVRAPQPL